MGNEIKIKIHQNQTLLGVLIAVSLMAFVMCGIYSLLSFYQSSIFLIMFILSLASGALTVLFVYLAVRPTVVWSDGEQLRWKYIFREHSIYLTEITDVLCEPYFVSSRYGAYQRIRLTLCTNSETGDIDFTDSVNAGDLIDEKLGRSKAEIPLLQLNNYLREQCCKHEW
ncbi:MAG: hypothetical protein K5876_06245 [Ruminiclostridium sp.]|nr:hypothetical protein [Ruminiclostridium sp.]